MDPKKQKNEEETESQTESFDEVVKALLETPPKPKKKSKVSNTKKVSSVRKDI